MKIVFDNIIFSLQNSGGISVYWSEIIKRFIKQNNHNLFFFEPKAVDLNINRKSVFIDNKLIYRQGSFLNGLSRYFNINFKSKDKFIFHSSYYRTCKSVNAINITTVHDFTYEYFVKGLPARIHFWQKSKAIRKSKGIICISENTKSDLIKFFPDVIHKDIKVIYNGVSDSFKPIRKNELEGKFAVLNNKKFILYIGSRKRYKNFDLAVKAIKNCFNYSLVIVGGGKLSKAETSFLKKNLDDRYFHFLYLSEKELNIVYNYAFCLLYPSSYEGFGIPIVEAMSAGCPVITSRFSSIPEVCGDAAFLINDIKDSLEIDSLFKKLENHEIRDLLIKKGIERSKNFSWDKSFNEVVTFYNEVYNKN